MLATADVADCRLEARQHGSTAARVAGFVAAHQSSAEEAALGGAVHFGEQGLDGLALGEIGRIPRHLYISAEVVRGGGGTGMRDPVAIGRAAVRSVKSCPVMSTPMP